MFGLKVKTEDPGMLIIHHHNILIPNHHQGVNMHYFAVALKIHHAS
jgi:hypothetical protein